MVTKCVDVATWENSKSVCDIYDIGSLNFKRCQQAQINKIQVSSAQNSTVDE